MLFKQYSNLSIKIIGPSIGDSGKPIIDGDLDGRCREENGNWIPCPPGTGTGAVEALQQAASIKPWDRSFEAGKWEQVDAQDHAMAMVTKALTAVNRNAPKAVIEGQARSIVARMKLEGKPVFVNGPVAVVQGNMAVAVVKDILKQIDNLYSLNPPKSKLLIEFKDLAPGVDGATYPVLNENETIRMELDRKLFSRAVDRIPARPKVLKKKPYNQNTVSIEKRKWVLVHEWGHAIDTRAIEHKWTANTPMDTPYKDGLFLLYRNSPDAGEYASTNQHEMYAESFADWATSGGKSTNPVTVAYAKEFGWKAKKQ